MKYGEGGIRTPETLLDSMAERIWSHHPARARRMIPTSVGVDGRRRAERATALGHVVLRIELPPDLVVCVCQLVPVIGLCLALVAFANCTLDRQVIISAESEVVVEFH